MVTVGKKVCTRCNRELDRTQFSKHVRWPDGLRSYCKTCQSEENRRYREKNRDYFKRYRSENPEQHVEGVRRYFLTDKGKATSARGRHKRRSKEASTENTLTEEQWRWIIEKQKGRCVACGKKFTENIPPTRDHITPISSGGGLTVQNTVALCRPCNSAKGHREPTYTAQRGLL